jgi:hypothetical protein
LFSRHNKELQAMPLETIKCTAKEAFTEYVSGHGMVHGDPNSSDKNARAPMVPLIVVERLAEAGSIAKPKGFTGASKDDAGDEAPTE